MADRRHTLLIVDDEPDVLESLRHLFHRDYRVLTATSAAAALDQLGQAPAAVHVILSDQRMPSMTGDEFLARARQIAPDAVRLLFTGYADIQAVINAINRAGIFRYILKPWEPLELEAILRQAVEQYDLLADRRRLIADLQEANTRLVRANRELADADQLKTAFLEVASHELNTPITIVQGLSELLLLTTAGRDHAERGTLRQIAEGTRQLGRLVSNMLKLVESGDFRERLRAAPTALGPLLREATDRVRPFVDARSLRLSVEIDDDLGDFEIDADKIGDVILNLLTNAIKFTPDHGAIALSARLVAPELAEIQVVDRGIGLDPRALRRLFSPFFTEFDPKSHSSGDFGFGKRGLGLGLYLVRTFVEMHGGTVSADSVESEGTTVTIRLPRKPCPGPDFRVKWVGTHPGEDPDATAPRTGV
jgi:signal transduction histidine kinase